MLHMIYMIVVFSCIYFYCVGGSESEPPILIKTDEETKTNSDLFLGIHYQ